MTEAVSRRGPRITSACCRLRLPSWPCSDARGLPHRSTLSRFLAALDQASVEALLGVFAARMRWLARDPRRAWVVCGTGEGNDGWSSIWTAPDRPHDSVHCLRVLIYPLHSGGCKPSVRLATRGASVGK